MLPPFWSRTRSSTAQWQRAGAWPKCGRRFHQKLGVQGVRSFGRVFHQKGRQGRLLVGDFHQKGRQGGLLVDDFHQKGRLARAGGKACPSRREGLPDDAFIKDRTRNPTTHSVAGTLSPVYA